jgi:hypothetical protein
LIVRDKRTLFNYFFKFHSRQIDEIIVIIGHDQKGYFL